MITSPEKTALVIMAKWPEPGRVKTRLAAAIGERRAAAVQMEMLELTVARQFNRGYRDSLAVTPPRSMALFRRRFPEAAIMVQAGGDLGARILAVVDKAGGGEHAVLVLGADTPDLPGEYVDQAHAHLADADLVLGPTPDGGFYLLGAGGLKAGIFKDVAWSADTVLATVLANAGRLGTKTVLLPEWPDVDTAADLTSWRRRDPAAARFPREEAAGGAES